MRDGAVYNNLDLLIRALIRVDKLDLRVSNRTTL